MNDEQKPYLYGHSGLASFSDLQSDEWRELFSTLESEQDPFLAKESDFRPPGYRWSRNSLRYWSRAWEYPFVYHHLRRWCADPMKTKAPVVVDLGCAVTFFPFAISKLGGNMLCLDIDPSCEEGISKATECLRPSPGSVSFRLVSGGRLPLEDGEADALYCISVLEHIPNFEDTINEMARVLKDDGLLIITMDLDMCGHMEIKADRYKVLRENLSKHFDMLVPERQVHPMDIYQMISPGPFRSPRVGFYPTLRSRCKQTLKRLLGKKPISGVPNLAIWAGVMNKRREEKAIN